MPRKYQEKGYYQKYSHQDMEKALPPVARVEMTTSQFIMPPNKLVYPMKHIVEVLVIIVT